MIAPAFIIRDSNKGGKDVTKTPSSCRSVKSLKLQQQSSTVTSEHPSTEYYFYMHANTVSAEVVESCRVKKIQFTKQRIYPKLQRKTERQKVINTMNSF